MAEVSPCNKPMRKRERVIEKMGWEQRWARMGVKAVSEPQAVAASRRTFSPPTLEVHGSLVQTLPGRRTAALRPQRLFCFSPVADVAPEHLGEAVAPEEAAQHHPGLLLAPVELFRQADGTDGHRHAGAVEQACSQQKHHSPHPRQRPAEAKSGGLQVGNT